MAKNPIHFGGRLAALRLSTSGQWLACAVLALLCLLAAVRLGMLLLAPPEHPQVHFAAVQGERPPAAIALYPEANVVAETREALSESSVDASLLGVVHLDGRSLASIAVKREKEKVYKVGDSLAPGITVEQIEPHRVVVRERGALRQISLNPFADNAAPILTEDGAPDPGEENSELPLLAVTPELSADGVAGLRVDQLDADLEARNLVQRGDLVVAVDDVALSSLMSNRSAIERLMQRDMLTLTVIRDDRETTVEVDGDLMRAMMNDY